MSGNGLLRRFVPLVAALAATASAVAGEAPPLIVPLPPPTPRPMTTPTRPILAPNAREGIEIDAETAENLVENIPDYVVLCQVCRGRVRQVRLLKPGPAPESPPVFDDGWDLRSDDVDVDLCPYPEGLVRFRADITQCPHCGFAARQPDFLEVQPPSVREWVASEITPKFRLALLRMVGEPAPPEGGSIPEDVTRRMAEVFVRQSDLPDILRMESARAYYAHLGADVAVISRMTQLTAWSYRRAQNESPEGAFMLEGIRPVLHDLEANKLVKDDPQALLERIYGLLEEKTPAGLPRFTWHQRQCAQFIIAGYYDRLGYLSWAKHCLDMAEREARKVDGDRPELDPMWPDLDGELDHEAKVMQLGDRRRAIINVALMRKQRIDLEAMHLTTAAVTLRRALASEDAVERWADLPARIFLVGEWFRRAEHYALAATWLSAADKLRRLIRAERETFDRDGLEIMADAQLDRLKEYVAGLPEPRPDLNAVDEIDRLEVDRLVVRYQTAREAFRGRYNAARSDGAGIGEVPAP